MAATSRRLLWQGILVNCCLINLSVNGYAQVSAISVVTPAMKNVSAAVQRGQFTKALILLDTFEDSLGEDIKQFTANEIGIKRVEILLASGKPEAAMVALNQALISEQPARSASQQAALSDLMGVAQLRLKHIEQAVQSHKDSLKAADPGVLAIYQRLRLCGERN